MMHHATRHSVPPTTSIDLAALSTACRTVLMVPVSFPLRRRREIFGDEWRCWSRNSALVGRVCSGASPSHSMAERIDTRRRTCVPPSASVARKRDTGMHMPLWSCFALCGFTISSMHLLRCVGKVQTATGVGNSAGSMCMSAL